MKYINHDTYIRVHRQEHIHFLATAHGKTTRAVNVKRMRYRDSHQGLVFWVNGVER